MRSATADQPAAQYSHWRRLEEKWAQMQVGRQGSYSVERLECLGFYCKTTTKARVVFTCCWAPLPAFGAAVFLECLPLRPPSEGWAANWVFWLRVLVLQVMISFAGATRTVAFVSELGFPVHKRLLVALGVSFGYVGTCILVAATLGFPVPFMMQLGAIPIGILTPVMIRIVQGPDVFATDSPFGDRLNHAFAHMLLVMVYPIYKVLYEAVPSAYRGSVVVVLPLWKIIAKLFVVWSARDLEDCIPELVSFVVDFFGTLFVSVCLYSSTSFYLSGLIILADVGLSLLEFREIHTNAKVAVKILRDRRASHDGPHLNLRVRSIGGAGSTELLEAIIAVTRDPKAHLVEEMAETRLWSCVPCPITQEQRSLLQALEAADIYGHRSNSTSSGLTIGNQQRHQPRFSQRRVLPAPILNAQKTSPEICGNNLELADRSKKLVLEGLQLLFHCEYLTLVQYVECAVPLIYMTYQLILGQLPNAIYYPSEDTDWKVTSVANIMVFVTLKVASFLCLSSFLQKTFSFSPLYQLAFVLYSRRTAVQVHLLIAMLLLLQYELAHYGKDCDTLSSIAVCIL